MTLQPHSRSSNGQGLRRMNDIFDSMYQNLLKMGNNRSIDPTLSSYKQETAESNLLSDKKDHDYTVKKEPKADSLDIILMTEQIAELKKELQKKNKIIQELEQGSKYKGKGTTYQQMNNQLIFLSQNNQTLYRTTYKLEEQISKLKDQLQQKIEKQNQLSKKVQNYQKQISALKKINKQLRTEQRELIKSQVNDVKTFRQVKTKYEKENDILKGKLKLLQIEREKDLKGYKKNLDKSIQKYMSAQNPNTNSFSKSVNISQSPVKTPLANLRESQVNELKGEINKLKMSVNQLSSRQRLSRKKSVCGTPVKKHK